MRKNKVLMGLILFLLFPLSAHSMDGKAYRDLPSVKKGGSIKLVLPANPPSLNPLLNFNLEVAAVINNLFVPLMMEDKIDGGVFPLLATVSISKDKTLYTYTLNEKAVWSDGTPITSDDAEFTFATLMSKASEAGFKGAIFAGFEFKKIDLRRFSLKTNKPNVNTFRDINDDFRIIQKVQFANEKDFTKAASLLKPVTSGPYSVKSFSPNETLVLERNPKWWAYSLPEVKNLFNFDLLKYSIISDAQLAYEKLVRGDIDLLNLNMDSYRNSVKGTDKEKFDTSSDGAKPFWAAHFRSKNSPTVTFLNWNEKNELFQSRQVRQALAQLIDYQEIISKVFGEEADRSFSPFGSNTPNTDPGLGKSKFELNVGKALKLLEKQGWKDNDSSGRLSKKINGKLKYFEFTILYNSENIQRAKIAQILREKFKVAGIVANLQASEFTVMIDRMKNHDYDSVIFNFGGGSINADAEGLWASKSIGQGGLNVGSYRNKKVDDLIMMASTESDPVKHFAINKKISKIIYEDQPAAFLLEVNGVFIGFNKTSIDSRGWFSQFDFNAPIERYYSK